MALSPTTIPTAIPATFGGARRWLSRLRLAAGLFLVLYLLFLSNVVAFRHPWCLDLTEERLHSLSRSTLDRLKYVKDEILVIIPTELRRDRAADLAHRDVLERAYSLLQQYVAVQPLLKIVAQVDVLASPDRWVQLRDEYDLSPAQVNRLIFITGPGKELRQAVTVDDLATFEEAQDPELVPPRVKRFHGEKAFTDAITRLIERRKRPVYFTQDRGEPGLRAPGGRDAGSLGALLHDLATEGMEPRELSIATAKEVPSDCALLVIAGPFQPYTREELAVIDRYLQQGGKLLATLGPRRTGLEDLLADWGVKVLEGSVQGRLTLPGKTIGTVEVPVRSFDRQHPVTSVFANVPRFEVVLYQSRAFEPAGSSRFLESGPILDVISSANEAYYLVPPTRDVPLSKPGDHHVAMAVEQRVPPRPPPGFQRLETRILVIGSTSLLTEPSFLHASHRDFLLNGAAWLLGEEEKASVSGQEWTERVLRTSPSIERFLFWVPVFLLPGLFLALGAFVYHARSR